LNSRLAAAKKAATLKVKKAIPPEDQMLWKFSMADSRSKLEWEHSREFEYKGEMYDVIRSEKRGDTMWYWCYWDRKETKLKNQLNIVVFNLMGPGAENRNSSQLISDFFKTLFHPVTDRQTNLALEDQYHRCIPPYSFSLNQYRTAPPAPPPWLS